MSAWRGHRCFGFRRIVAAALVFATSVAASSQLSAQVGKAEVTADMARKKAAMLEMFLASKKLSTVLIARPDAAQPLVESARVHLDTGWEMLDANDPVGATGHFDKGIEAVSQAIALSTDKGAASPDGTSRANENRLREARAYIEVLGRAEGLSAEDEQIVAALRARLADADAAASSGDKAGAWQIINDLYPEVVQLVSKAQRGQTAFVSKTFDTPEEALEYERARHDNHRLLVELALAERAEFQPGLNNLAASLSTLSDHLRTEADAHATAGRTVEAVKTMQRATERLSAILRAAGLIVSGSDGGQ